METIKAGGREYEVTATARKRADGRATTDYLLTGPRGAVYALIREAVSQKVMFALGRRRMPRDLGRAWFSDADGTLRVLP